ncbi:hypothetical protein DSM106972_019690 [Dulcicalothrix desertica PCC 7102]|uniref:Filamentous haemagglutinin FhaB/tRNA nuclease CdiA-like TPS domain-containing protein n=2 Tax=Dulcicalothrix desertica TaxID=32056 RepID=A0A433VNQ1_9CYAN|nr:hypothetical protein DSM106972_019690 [Dulcicalothrix desertica PCC 7102]TWH39879.1 filamentous hemagglutinin family protein [Dulcicalothrix desertica PCC 7102]
MHVIFVPGEVIAQIVPDTTLPINSQVTQQQSINAIEGGTTAGTSLFHSFDSFSVPTGSSVFFNNAQNIQNILSRVTGQSISNIDGLIRANGSANLFLLNPNGITFGKNARLDIGGSFIGSTASSLKFANDTTFSAKASESTPLLTIGIPVGLQYGVNPGKIEAQENTLQVQPNQTLAFFGGEIILKGSTLMAPGGQIELGSVSDNSLVKLTPVEKGLNVGYSGVQNFGTIQVESGSNIDASGIGGGDIRLTARNLRVNEGSRLASFTLASGTSGDITLNATESIELTGTGGYIEGLEQVITPTNIFALRNGIYNSSVGESGSGAIEINTQKLSARDGFFILASPFGRANGGSININASESIEVISSLFSTGGRIGSTGDGSNFTINTRNMLLSDAAIVSTAGLGTGRFGNLSVSASESLELIGGNLKIPFFNDLRTLLTTATTSLSDAGNLEINTKILTVRDGAQISASTVGQGKGGNLTINASSLVEVIGISSDGMISSGIFVQADPGTTAPAGNLTLNTRELLVSDGALIAATAFGAGKGGNLTVNATDIKLLGTANDRVTLSRGLSAQAAPNSTGAAGDLTINTRNLLVRDGAQVNSGTFGVGKGGNLTVNADGTVELIGASKDGIFASGLFAEAGLGTTGAAGDLKINVNKLIVRDGARVAVRSQGKGNAGNFTVNAHSIRLDNKATFTADTQSINIDPRQEQATITLNTEDLILRRGSNITTNAKGQNVIGGNININTRVLAAFEDSDIGANSTDGRGGNIKIKTQGIFGTQFRNIPSINSDITATGASSQLSGNVEINQPDVDATSGLFEISVDFVDASHLIVQGCPAYKGNSFIITGRGGLPSLPNSIGRSNLALGIDWVENRVLQGTETIKHNNISRFPINSYIKQNQIVEASSWQINQKGEVLLTASKPITKLFSSTSDLSIKCY